MAEEEKTNTTEYSNDNQQQTSAKSAVQNGTVSAVQRIINNRIASAGNADVVTVSNDNMMSGFGTESVAAYDQMETYQSFKDQLMQYCLDNGVFDSRDSQEATALGQQLDTTNACMLSLNDGDETAIDYKEMYNNITSSNDVKGEVSKLELVSGAWATLAAEQNVSNMYKNNLANMPERMNMLTDVMENPSVNALKITYGEEKLKGTESAEMLDSQNTSEESEHVYGKSESTYQKAKEKFISENIAPYYESSSSEECVAVGDTLDSMKNKLDEMAGSDTGNSSYWNDYFKELGEQSGISAIQKVEQDAAGVGVKDTSYAINGMFNSVIHNFTEMPQNIGKDIANGVEGVEKTIGDLANNAKDGISNVIQMGQNGLSNMGATIGDMANNAGQTIGSMLNSGNNDVSNSKPSAVDLDSVSYNQNSQDSGDYSLLESKMMNSRYC